MKLKYDALELLRGDTDMEAMKAETRNLEYRIGVLLQMSKVLADKTLNL